MSPRSPSPSLRRSPRVRAGLLVAALAAAAGACDSTDPGAATAINLDRPVDVAFSCFGGLRLTGGGPATAEQPLTVSAMPATACAIRSGVDDETTTTVDERLPPGQERIEGAPGLASVDYYAFIVQSVPGTVAVARFDTKPSGAFAAGSITEGNVLDSDPLTPGKNGISVGSLPIAIATDRAGCHVTTANAGSCDLSVLDVTSSLQFNSSAIVNRVTVTNAGAQPVLARPAAMVAEPASGVIGQACPAQPSGLVYVAYPACHLVAAIDGNGRIVAGVQFAADGTATITDGNVSCAAECGAGVTAGTAGPRPVSLDLVDDARVGTRRLAIGAENSNRVTVVDLDASYLPTAIEQVALVDADGTLGVIDVALSKQIGMGGTSGQLNDDIGVGGQAQFVYAVATDRTVRVADVLDDDRECETQADPRYLHDQTSVSQLACLPIGDPLVPRRARARGPGITLPVQGAPLAVTTFSVDRAISAQAGSDPQRLAGHYAAITSTTGSVFLANIDDDSYYDTEDSGSPLQADLSLALPHQLRDATPGRSDLAERESEFICQTDGPAPPDAVNQVSDSGGPRTATTPTRNVTAAAIASEKTSSLPGLRGVLCDATDGQRAVSELSFAAPLAVREATFPDWGSLEADESWRLEWEGRLSNDSSQVVDGPPVRIGLVRVGGTGMRVVDASRPFCAAGVEPHDQVVLRGCDPNQGNLDCPLDYSCYVHPDAEVATGSCLPTDQIDFLAGPCRDFLVSRRVYSVGAAAADELPLVERPRVLRTSPLTGCTSAQQCQQLADVEARLVTSAHPVDDDTTAEPRMWACEQEPSRGPGPDRCVMHCQSDDDCLSGDVCNDAGVCVMGPVPPLQCVTGAQRYEMRASEAFVVIGSRTGYLHPIVEGPGGVCQRDPGAHPLEVGRIPLTAPACAGDGLTDLLPNPCSLTVPHAERQPRYQAGTCTLADPSDELVVRSASGIRFRNRGFTLTVTDPTYPGDATCRGDRGGTLVGVPTVFPGMVLQFRQVGGFLPMVPDDVDTTMPVRVVRGPQDSVWVVDEGDFLSSGAAASTRGRVVRFEGANITTVNTIR